MVKRKGQIYLARRLNGPDNRFSAHGDTRWRCGRGQRVFPHGVRCTGESNAASYQSGQESAAVEALRPMAPCRAALGSVGANT